jgi:actinorhodin biosynthesis protein ActVIA
MQTTTTTQSELYSEVLQFYARQMQALDGGDFKAYSETFTEDGEFRHTPGQEPARTREGIVRELDRFHERFDGDPVQRRHWFNMVDLEPQPDGTIVSTAYALVITTRPGGKPDIAPSCVVRDVLVRQDSVLLNRSRQVDHDQLP